MLSVCLSPDIEYSDIEMVLYTKPKYTTIKLAQQKLLYIFHIHRHIYSKLSHKALSLSLTFALSHSTRTHTHKSLHTRTTFILCIYHLLYMQDY